MFLEKDLEDLLVKYPELIEEGLSLTGRQVNIHGFRADLLFKDKFEQDLIVELKRGEIKREHLGQLMEYVGGILEQDKPTTRAMLIGAIVPLSIRKAMDHYGIEWRELPTNRITNFLIHKDDKELLQRFTQGSSQKMSKPSSAAAKDKPSEPPGGLGDGNKVALLISSDSPQNSVYLPEGKFELFQERIDECGYALWGTGWRGKPKGLYFPCWCYVNFRSTIIARMNLEDIISFDTTTPLPDDPGRIPRFRYEEFRNYMRIGKIELLDGSISTLSLRKRDGMPIKAAPQGFYYILDPLS